MPLPKVAFINLGCRVNRVETDVIASELTRAGCEVVDQAEADAIVINTCAVTGEAEAKTRKIVRRAARSPKAPFVVACGCAANLAGEELSALADNVFVEMSKARVAARVLSEFGCIPGSVDDRGDLIQTPTPTGRMRPGIKVQDGCNNRCSFCIVWKARGPAHSTDPKLVCERVREACAQGAREIVLTGINLGDFRYNYQGNKLRLPQLLQMILDSTAIERLRLSSIEPVDISDELLDVMKDAGDRIAPFLHICLQSGSDTVLRRMRRGYTTAFYKDACMRARRRMPHVALGTDYIVGFPGETDEEFETGYAFCEAIGFAKMHIFRYSPRPGTPAAAAPDQVAPEVMARRSKKMHKLAQRMRKQQAEALIGNRDRVLVQAPGFGITSGLFDCHLPRTFAVDELVDVEISSVMDDGSLIVSCV